MNVGPKISKANKPRVNTGETISRHKCSLRGSGLGEKQSTPPVGNMPKHPYVVLTMEFKG